MRILYLPRITNDFSWNPYQSYLLRYHSLRSFPGQIGNYLRVFTKPEKKSFGFPYWGIFAFYPNEPVVRNQLVSFWSQKMLRVHRGYFFLATRQGSFDHVDCCPLAPGVRIYSLPSRKVDILSHLHGKQKVLAFTKGVLGLFSICFTLYPLPSLGGRIQCVHPWPSSPDGVEGTSRKASRWVAVMMQYMTIASMYMKEPAQQDVPRRMGFASNSNGYQTEK